MPVNAGWSARSPRQRRSTWNMLSRARALQNRALTEAGAAWQIGRLTAHSVRGYLSAQWDGSALPTTKHILTLQGWARLDHRTGSGLGTAGSAAVWKGLQRCDSGAAQKRVGPRCSPLLDQVFHVEHRRAATDRHMPRSVSPGRARRRPFPWSTASMRSRSRH